MTNWRIKWFNDWQLDGTNFDLRLLEVSIASGDGIAFGVIVLGLGFAIYRPTEPDVYGDGGEA